MSVGAVQGPCPVQGPLHRLGGVRRPANTLAHGVEWRRRRVCGENQGNQNPDHAQRPLGVRGGDGVGDGYQAQRLIPMQQLSQPTVHT